MSDFKSKIVEQFKNFHKDDVDYSPEKAAADAELAILSVLSTGHHIFDTDTASTFSMTAADIEESITVVQSKHKKTEEDRAAEQEERFKQIVSDAIAANGKVEVVETVENSEEEGVANAEE